MSCSTFDSHLAPRSGQSVAITGGVYSDPSSGSAKFHSIAASVPTQGYPTRALPAGFQDTWCSAAEYVHTERVGNDHTGNSHTHADESAGRMELAGGWHERILIVEDDIALQRALAVTLAGLGYSVQTAVNGREALRAWQMAAPEQRPQLLLTGVERPAPDGAELLRLVRADDPGLPIIVMTNFSSGAALIHALRLHADDFLGKPVEIAELKTSLDRALSARRQRIAYEAERTRAACLQAVLETATAVNHEINNPLAAISASAQLMRRHLSSGAERQLPDATNSEPACETASLTTCSRGTENPNADTASLNRLLDVIIEQCERIADFNRKLTGIVNPVTCSSGGQRMLDVEHSR